MRLKEILSNLKGAYRSFYYHSQSRSTSGKDWGFGFNWDGRKIFYFHDLRGWHNHSEKHRRENCNDPAYCPWHGAL